MVTIINLLSERVLGALKMSELLGIWSSLAFPRFCFQSRFMGENGWLLLGVSHLLNNVLVSNQSQKE